jgi:hypothetical protein
MARDSEDQASIDVALISPEGVDKVVSFIPVLSAIPVQEIERGSELSLEPDYHPAVIALMEAFRENHFVQPFEWGHWGGNAAKIFEDANQLSNATLETCIKLITLHVRQDRFNGGHFGEMVRSGHISAILHRLAALRESIRKEVPLKEPLSTSTAKT